MAGNACGDGAYSAAFSFTTADIPPILLVDDDDNSPDVRAFYTAALDDAGLLYDIWDTGNTDASEPAAVDLAPYDTVIWFTGEEFGGAAGPGSGTETALGTWLDAGRCLFISSQDYHWDKGLTAFVQDHLGVATVDDDEGQGTVTGTGSVFAGYGPYTLDYPFSNYSDEITADATAELAFSGDQGGAAVAKDNGTFRTTFWAFPFEALPTAADRQAALERVIAWCAVGADDPIFADGFENGTTDQWSWP
jgi:hypothetical protein